MFLTWGSWACQRTRNTDWLTCSGNASGGGVGLCLGRDGIDPASNGSVRVTLIPHEHISGPLCLVEHIVVQSSLVLMEGLEGGYIGDEVMVCRVFGGWMYMILIGCIGGQETVGRTVCQRGDLVAWKGLGVRCHRI